MCAQQTQKKITPVTTRDGRRCTQATGVRSLDWTREFWHWNKPASPAMYVADSCMTLSCAMQLFGSKKKIRIFFYLAGLWMTATRWEARLWCVVLLYDLECSFMVKGVQPSICSCHTHDREWCPLVQYKNKIVVDVNSRCRLPRVRRLSSCL